MRDLNEAGPFQPQHMGFDFAFGLGFPLDPSYGNFSATEVISYYNKTVGKNGKYEKIKEKRSIQLKTCGTELFGYRNQSEVAMYNINNYLCFNRNNYTL